MQAFTSNSKDVFMVMCLCQDVQPSLEYVSHVNIGQFHCSVQDDLCIIQLDLAFILSHTRTMPFAYVWAKSVSNVKQHLTLPFIQVLSQKYHMHTKSCWATHCAFADDRPTREQTSTRHTEHSWSCVEKLHSCMQVCSTHLQEEQSTCEPAHQHALTQKQGQGSLADAQQAPQGSQMATCVPIFHRNWRASAFGWAVVPEHPLWHADHDCFVELLCQAPGFLHLSP